MGIRILTENNFHLKDKTQDSAVYGFRTVLIYLTSISRTHCVSGNRSHTLLFILSLMMNEWQVLQSPIFMALLAATTCSLMLSGGPVGVKNTITITTSSLSERSKGW